MRLIDSRHSEAAGTDLLASLSAAYAAEPGPAQLARMDARFERTMEQGPVHIGRRSWRRLTSVLAVAATMVVIAGAGTVVLQRFEGWSAPDFDVAWERGAVLGLSDTVDGYEVTLERAYADAGQVMLAVALEDLEQRAGTSQVGGLIPTLVDDVGGEYLYAGGPLGPVDRYETATLWYFDPPAFPLEAGARHFTLIVDGIEVRDDSLDNSTVAPDANGTLEGPNPWHPVAGRWTIEFDLTVAGGTMVEPGVVAEANGASITVVSLLLTPTRARLELRVVGTGPVGERDAPAGWEPVDITAQRGSTILRFGGSQNDDDFTTFSSAYAGVDDTKGEWVVTVGELVGPPVVGAVPPTPNDAASVTDQSQRLRGPWVLRVVID